MRRAYFQPDRVRARERRNLGLGYMAGPPGSGTPSTISKNSPAGIALISTGALLSIFGGLMQHHAQSVASEAAILNAAVPAFVQQIQQIFAAANAGQISAADARGYVDQMLAAYYQNVGSIIKKGQDCGIGSGCQSPGGSKPGNVSFSPCNGPCSVGCNYIEPAACVAKAILTSGGTATVPGLPAHAGFSGAPDLTLSFNAPMNIPSASLYNPQSPTQAAAATSAGVPTWMLWVGGAALAAKAAGVI